MLTSVAGAMDLIRVAAVLSDFDVLGADFSRDPVAEAEAQAGVRASLGAVDRACCAGTVTDTDIGTLFTDADMDLATLLARGSLLFLLLELRAMGAAVFIIAAGAVLLYSDKAAFLLLVV
jgi:hypothetical protein